MKQLKIVKSQVDTKSPFFTASFTESISIPPDSKIWFDKISFNIVSSGPDGSIQLGEQTIAFAPNILGDENLSQGYRNLYLAPNTYQNIGELYRALQTLINGSLTSNPIKNWHGKLPDTGLAIQILPATTQVAGQTVQTTEIAFVQANVLEQLNQQDINIAYNEPWWIPESVLPWQLIYPTPILAGALQCNTAVYAPFTGEYSDNECFVGLYTRTGQGPVYNYVRSYGVIYSNGVWSYYNNGGLSEIVDQIYFTNPNDPPTTFMSFHVNQNDYGHLQFSLIDPAIHEEYLFSPAGTFEGYDVNINYFFGADGFQGASILPVKILNPTLTYQPNVVQTNSGWQIISGSALNKNIKGLTLNTLGDYQPFPTLDVIENRNIRFKFQDSQSLSAGLGFGSIIVNMGGLEGSYTGTTSIGFVNFFDLALDVYNFDLDSYMSSDVTRGKVKAVGYFVPQPASLFAGQTLYLAETKQLTYIDINNIEEQVIESLNFRIYNPQNPKQTFVLSNVSFSLFILGGDSKNSADELLIHHKTH